MQKIKYLLYIFFCFFFCVLFAKAQIVQKEDTLSGNSELITISLLTCSPGNLVYELYGHTSLRVREGRTGMENDWVFNYGTFSFNTPHFIWHFLLGETDYVLGVIPYNFFYEEYANEGRAIYEQKLNLTQKEAKKLVDLLSENVKPENSTYRYNFFYDNCVTRPIKMIEKSVDGKIIWPNIEKEQSKTLRDIIHEFSENSSWNKFGQDLLLGSEVDKPSTLTQQMFAPIYAQRFVDNAKIKDSQGNIRPLTNKTVCLLPAQKFTNKSSIVSPIIFFGILLAFTIVLTLYEKYRKENYWIFDTLLFIIQGFAGCIITFLFFFSSHPAVGSNWLIILFNPFPLLYFPWLMKNGVNNQFSKGMYVEAIMLFLTFLVGITSLQNIPCELYLLIAILTIRVFAHIATFKCSTQKRVIF